MEYYSWSLLLISLSICLFIKTVFNLISSSTQTKLPLPPSSLCSTILFTIQSVGKGIAGLEPTLCSLFSKYGPIVLLQIGSTKAIFVRSHELAFEALVTQGSTFADRLPPTLAMRRFTYNQHNIHTAAYGPLWRLFRRNLTSEILHPSRIKSFAHARKLVLDVLVSKLKQESSSGTESVCVVSHLKSAMVGVFLFMCFGDEPGDGAIKELESIQREFVVSLGVFNILNSLPEFVSKILFAKRWNSLYKLRRKQESFLLPLIRARRENKNKGGVISYVDTLLNLSEGGKELDERQIVTLCTEFLNAGSDTTSTALQWIMANLVKHGDIQAKLFDEINANTEQDDGQIREDDLQKMPYLKAVVLEGLRRHPPSRFVLPHVVTQDTVLDGYLVPKGAVVNFMIADMGRDPKVWEEPMEFRPERFLSNGGGQVFDLTGSREIKMMPFGAGRRICPAFGLGILHLEYFVANLIKKFEWTSGDGDDVDLSETPELVISMKNPFRSRITPRLS